MAALRDRNGRETVVREARFGADLGGTGLRFEKPAAVRADLRAGPDGIRVRVRAEVEGLADCDRCLEPVAVPIRLDYRELYLTPEQAGPRGAGDDGGDVRRIVYEGDAIDLSEGLRQNLLLALPMKVVCREDCRGLCPRCGRNLNEGECGCRVEDIDPRMEALRPLLEKLAAEKDRPLNR